MKVLRINESIEPGGTKNTEAIVGLLIAGDSYATGRRNLLFFSADHVIMVSDNTGLVGPTGTAGAHITAFMNQEGRLSFSADALSVIDGYILSFR